MADVPAQINYGQVVGRFVSFVADTTDVSNVPDEVPLDGSVTLTPLTTVLRLPSTTPPRLAVAQQVKARVVTGDLCPADSDIPGVFVIATDQPAAQPSRVQWYATFQLSGVTSQPAPLVFNVPTNGVVDLSVLVSIPPEPPVTVVVSTATAEEAAQSAADAAASAVVAASAEDAAIAAGTEAEAAADEAQAAAALLAQGKAVVVLGPTAPIPGGTPTGAVILRTAT